MVDVVTQSQATKLHESVMVRDCFVAMHSAMGLPPPSHDLEYNFAALFVANQTRFRSVEMALLVSLNSVLRNRDLTQEDVATIVRNAGSYENADDDKGT